MMVAHVGLAGKGRIHGCFSIVQAVVVVNRRGKGKEQGVRFRFGVVAVVMCVTQGRVDGTKYGG